MTFYDKTVKSTLNYFKTDEKTGLSSERALDMLEKHGGNELDDKSGKKNIIIRFLLQLNDFMVIILIIAAGVSFLISYIKGENDFIDSVIILAIVMLNAIIGLIQESKAEKAVLALKNMSAPKAKVLRNGRITETNTKSIVPGDIMVFEAGDYISADGRIIEAYDLKCEESSISGESGSVSKFADKVYNQSTPLGDRRNMVFSTSFVTYGKGKAIVTSTGMDTEVGKIADMLSFSEESQTPLQKRLGDTSRILGIGALGICILIFALGVIRKFDPFDMFMTSISLAVAAIPEGLPAIVTIVLAIGMQRMSKKNTIIRKLPAVETLGCAGVICSDKTGTLTNNKMKVIKISDSSRGNITNPVERKFILELASLCTDLNITNGIASGDPTETALFEAWEETGGDARSINEKYPREYTIPFSSERKMMTSLNRLSNASYISASKGAIEVLLPKCSRYIENGKILPLTDGVIGRIKAQNVNMAKNALRVIAVCYGEYPHKPRKAEIEENLIFAGLAGMIDPPRKEAYEAVALCRKAGIKPVMITGDHALTAITIARDLGIYKDGDMYMTGEELQTIDQEKLSKNIEKYSVFARVAPEHKVSIVKAFQSRGYVVAMTGDGVNDAPALKASDIGCAMGKSGTDVAKGAADMVLMDDNFATIVEAVREGRGIYSNIKKAVHFLISSNIGEILCIFIAMLFGWHSPLLPIQLLWVNFVTDSLPAIALGLEPVEADVMSHRPIKANESFFSNGLGFKIALEGMLIGLLTLIAFGIGHIYFDKSQGYVTGRTMAFAVLSISQLVHSFNMRSEKSLLSINFLSNKFIIIAFLSGLFLQVFVISFAPLSAIFGVCPLEPKKWFIVALLSIVPLFVSEAEKAAMPADEKKRERRLDF
ncbi:MAG: cation-translocating P-type ATPase [Lachnospiraceae bacterium]|nr:cation-translocating P-type ATPase [Lachnospiraceae bacterium]